MLIEFVLGDVRLGGHRHVRGAHVLGELGWGGILLGELWLGELYIGELVLGEMLWGELCQRKLEWGDVSIGAFVCHTSRVWKLRICFEDAISQDMFLFNLCVQKHWKQNDFKTKSNSNALLEFQFFCLKI